MHNKNNKIKLNKIMKYFRFFCFLGSKKKNKTIINEYMKNLGNNIKSNNKPYKKNKLKDFLYLINLQKNGKKIIGIEKYEKKSIIIIYNSYIF